MHLVKVANIRSGLTGEKDIKKEKSTFVFSALTNGKKNTDRSI